LLDSGIVYLSSRATLDLLNLSWVAPLSSCTSHGLDLGPAPVRFELYTDVLLPMNPSMTYEQFLATPLPDRNSNPDDGTLYNYIQSFVSLSNMHHHCVWGLTNKQ
jgi:hypothetical protein